MVIYPFYSIFIFSVDKIMLRCSQANADTTSQSHSGRLREMEGIALF